MARKEYNEKLEKLDNIPHSKSGKIERGIQFEKLINDLFEDEEILLKRSYHTRDNQSEQIDGAIKIGEKIFLLEVKWVESGLAASDLYAFIGKVDNKMYGTLGLFISKEKLTPNFIDAVSKGRQRKIIIIHGNSVKKMFELEKGKIIEYLKSAIYRYSFDNESYFSVEDYLKQNENNAKITEIQKSSDKTIKDYILFITNLKRLDDISIFEKTEQLTLEQKNKVFEYLILNYPKYYKKYNDSYAKDESFKNINDAFNYLNIFDQPIAIEVYLNAITKEIDIAYFLQEIWGKIKNRLINLNDEKKNKLSEALCQVLYKVSGDYNKENIITECIKEYWDYIDINNKGKIIAEYINYYYSCRTMKFSQKSFANDIITKFKDNTAKKAAENWIKDKIKEDINYLNEEEKKTVQNEQLSKYFCKNYKELSLIFECSMDEYIKKIEKEYESLKSVQN